MVIEGDGKLNRTFVTYATAPYVDYLAMSMFTLGRTQPQARAVVFIDEIDDAAVRALISSASDFGLPVEFRPVSALTQHVDLERFEALIGPYRDTLPSIELLFSDMIRSALYASVGGAVVWFDADLLFLGDVDTFLPEPGEGVLAVAEDSLLLQGEQPWIDAFDRFVGGVGFASRTRPRPANIGLIALGVDCHDAYLEALSRTLPVACNDPLKESLFSIGQLAWDLVFWEQGCVWLDSTINTPSAKLAPVGQDPSAVVRHYLTPWEKKRMAVDFVQGLSRGWWKP